MGLPGGAGRKRWLPVEEASFARPYSTSPDNSRPHRGAPPKGYQGSREFSIADF